MPRRGRLASKLASQSPPQPASATTPSQLPAAAPKTKTSQSVTGDWFATAFGSGNSSVKAAAHAVSSTPEASASPSYAPSAAASSVAPTLPTPAATSAPAGAVGIARATTTTALAAAVAASSDASTPLSPAADGEEDGGGGVGGGGGGDDAGADDDEPAGNADADADAHEADEGVALDRRCKRAYFGKKLHRTELRAAGLAEWTAEQAAAFVRDLSRFAPKEQAYWTKLAHLIESTPMDGSLLCAIDEDYLVEAMRGARSLNKLERGNRSVSVGRLRAALALFARGESAAAVAAIAAVRLLLPRTLMCV
jgi:hypothetical protein